MHVEGMGWIGVYYSSSVRSSCDGGVRSEEGPSLMSVLGFEVYGYAALVVADEADLDDFGELGEDWSGGFVEGYCVVVGSMGEREIE